MPFGRDCAGTPYAAPLQGVFLRKTYLFHMVVEFTNALQLHSVCKFFTLQHCKVFAAKPFGIRDSV